MLYLSSLRPFLGVVACCLLPGLAGPLQTARAATPTVDTARVIVKFKATVQMAGRAQAQAVATTSPEERATSLGVRTGLTLSAGVSQSDRSQVVTAAGMSSTELAARLSTQPEVEYAVVDQRRRTLAVPNDPLYSVGGTRGPVSGQWYLRPPNTTTPASINAESAWDTTTGNSSIVVAVVDTGVRFDHADLLPVAQGGNLLPGYDFVSDPATANDSDPLGQTNSRDADASDPGDWVTVQENAAGGAFAGCGVSSSLWHGTQVAALIAASTNNGLGMASVGRTVRLLPVRALGKCGGFDSDILAGMRWAAGLAVPGVPTNTTPAKVINLSLGGDGACTQSYRDAVAEVNGVGAVVVVSAGNTTGHAVTDPANCPGVLAVAGLRHVGTKVGFSSLGPEVAIAAPGGNCVDTSAGAACQYPILTARNAGTTTPIAGSSVYSDSFTTTTGTSFSSPMVAATAALMFSLKPGITPAEVKTTLQQTARAFPTTGGDNGDGTLVTQCQAPQFNSAGTPIDQNQCYCTTTTCGAGMLDVGAAVRAVALSVAPPTTTTPPTSTPATSSGGGGGGGGLGWPWLLALFAAVAALWRARPAEAR